EPDGASDEGKEPDCGRYILPACPKILDPVCGTDNLTYPNECELCKAVTFGLVQYSGINVCHSPLPC
uniref:Kazal-like domain-containing protein n=1 Tax=Terrapene triunguis TaxID=2587831 RepID=A0A674INQ9_9SAUR